MCRCPGRRPAGVRSAELLLDELPAQFIGMAAPDASASRVVSPNGPIGRRGLTSSAPAWRPAVPPRRLASSLYRTTGRAWSRAASPGRARSSSRSRAWAALLEGGVGLHPCRGDGPLAGRDRVGHQRTARHVRSPGLARRAAQAHRPRRRDQLGQGRRRQGQPAEHLSRGLGRPGARFLAGHQAMISRKYSITRCNAITSIYWTRQLGQGR